MTDQVVAKFAKNGREQVRIALSEYHGHAMCSAWVWFRNGEGAMLPGKSGISLRVELLPELIRSLQEAEAQARKDGLLGREAA